MSKNAREPLASAPQTSTNVTMGKNTLASTEQEKNDADPAISRNSPILPPASEKLDSPVSQSSNVPTVTLMPRFKKIIRERGVSLDQGRDKIMRGMNYANADADGSFFETMTPEKEDQKGLTDEPHPTLPSKKSDAGANDSSEADTSDGESSYFAKHLPSPKSGRRFTIPPCDGSVSSAPARAELFASASISGSNHRRESDASLSFSDDEDEWTEEENAPTTGRAQLLPPTRLNQMGTNSSPDLYHTYPITRMRSVSSLVSSSDGEDLVRRQQTGKYDRRTANKSGLSGESSEESGATSTSDPSVRSELRDVAPSKKRALSKKSGTTPSGRKLLTRRVEGNNTTPNSGLVGRVFTSPPRYPQQSPPMILQDYANNDGAHQNFDYPQPHALSSTQRAAWFAGGNVAGNLGQPMYYPPLPMGYGATTMPGYGIAQFPNAAPSGTRFLNTSFNSENTKSTGDSQLVYSDDEDDYDNHGADSGENFGRQLSGGGRRQVGVGRDGNTASLDSGHTGSAKESTGYKQAPENVKVHQLKSYSRATSRRKEDRSAPAPQEQVEQHQGFKVYKSRWLMLGYMSMLNLLSDWTCYSVAPIALLTNEAYGNINPELLVTIFLASNALSSACEPIILSRLGLRRTVIFGALLLMIGSIIKSGGLPPILESKLVKGKDEWRVYAGFLLVGLSQPLYQCTPALLSASWFPEQERTLATGVALNANQLGIGCAFIFGSLLVSNSDDIPAYFGLLSIISTIMFLGTLMQFEDAPPTPPSDTARVMRGTLELNIPNIENMKDSLLNSVRNIRTPSVFPSASEGDPSSITESEKPAIEKPPKPFNTVTSVNQTESSSRGQRGGASPSKRRSAGGKVARSGTSGRKSTRSSSNRKASSKSGRSPSDQPQKSGGGTTRRRAAASSSRNPSASSDNGFRAGLPGMAGAPASTVAGRGEESVKRDSTFSSLYDPSPMMPGPVKPSPRNIPLRLSDNKLRAGSVGMVALSTPVVARRNAESVESDTQLPNIYDPSPMMPGPVGPVPTENEGNNELPPFNAAYYPDEGYPIPEMQYGNPYLHSGMPVHPQMIQHPYGSGYPQHPGYYYPNPNQDPYSDPYDNPYYYAQVASQYNPYEYPRSALPGAGTIDDLAEPVLTFTPNHLDIDIRDDQVILSIKACFARPGFIHALVSFTVSGIVINTLSTFMDYLVRLNGGGQQYVGIVGGGFQIIIMISSLIVGGQTDKTRAYYSVTVGMLVLGAFGLAECGVSLDADRGGDLRWALLIVAALVGPLQPVSTELGVDVVYPISENTVLVIQQLFSNLLSAAFIPFFKLVRDVGREQIDADDMYERPQYTFSFYLLIVIHAIATVFFATFNGRYLRYEHETAKKARAALLKSGAGTAFHPVQGSEYYEQNQYEEEGNGYGGERQPLINQAV